MIIVGNLLANNDDFLMNNCHDSDNYNLHICYVIFDKRCNFFNEGLSRCGHTPFLGTRVGPNRDVYGHPIETAVAFPRSAQSRSYRGLNA